MEKAPVARSTQRACSHCCNLCRMKCSSVEISSIILELGASRGSWWGSSRFAQDARWRALGALRRASWGMFAGLVGA